MGPFWSPWLRSRFLKRNLALAAVAVVAIYLVVRAGSGGASVRELRMGADNAPPYHVIQPDGSVQGLAVDIFNEAARRKNIRLVWVPVRGVKLDEALARGMVDAWPAVSRTPVRDARLHFSKPWLESSYCLVSRKSSDFNRGKSSGSRIAVTDSPRVSSIARQLFAGSRLSLDETNAAAVVEVCRGEADAALVESRTLDAALLDRPAGCGDIPLRIQLVPEATNPVSIASTREAGKTVDELRNAISSLATDGTFAAAVDRWAGFSANQTRSYFDLREKELTSMRSLYGLAVLAATGLVLLILFVKTRKAKKETEAALMAAADSESRFQCFMNNSPMVGFIKDEAGRLVYINRRFLEVFELTRSQCLGRDDFDLWPREIATGLRNNDLAILRENRAMELTETVVMPTGSVDQWLSVKFPFSMDGQMYVGGVSLNITDRARAEAALRDSEERFRSAFANAAIGMMLTDAEGAITQVNSAFCEITGYPMKDLLGRTAISITFPEDRTAAQNRQRNSIQNENSQDWQELRYLRGDGTTVWVRDSLGVVRCPNGEASHFIHLVEDISREKMAQDLARLNEERWHLALEGTNDGIWDWDARQNTVYYSARWKQMLGYEEWELPNEPQVWEHLVHPEDLKMAKDAVEEHLRGIRPFYHAEYRIRCKDGSYRWVMARGKAILDADRKPVRMIGAHADITERKRGEELLAYQANHDSLTGLTNRGRFLVLLEEKIGLARRLNTPLSLCICDIDNFKGINDKYGHQCGDEVLMSLAETLRNGVRGSDLAGRMGGDEFYVLLTETSAVHAARCLERIRNEFEALTFGSREKGDFQVTASFGVARFVSGMIVEDLIEAADLALYGAKRNGRNLVLAANARKSVRP